MHKPEQGFFQDAIGDPSARVSKDSNELTDRELRRIHLKTNAPKRLGRAMVDTCRSATGPGYRRRHPGRSGCGCGFKMKRTLSQDMIDDVLNAARNITMHNSHLDERRSGFQLIHKFPFPFSKTDQRKSQIFKLIDRLDLSIEEKIECIRRECISWGRATS
jgi:hypothetical protein